MKKSFSLTALFVSLVLIISPPVFAAETWEELVSGLEKRETVKTEGTAFLAELRKEAPQGQEFALWKLLWVGEARARAAAGVALMDKIFPGGDPGRWEEAGGFLKGTSFRPRQLAGMDAFFVTVAALDAIPGGEWTAAALLESFSKSGRGMIKFVERILLGVKGPIDSVISKTGAGGDWSVKATGRGLPLLPLLGGVITRGGAESKQLQYLDGAGRIAANGSYAWDRERGYIYQVTEGASRRFYYFD